MSFAALSGRSVPIRRVCANNNKIISVVRFYVHIFTTRVFLSKHFMMKGCSVVGVRHW